MEEHILLHRHANIMSILLQGKDLEILSSDIFDHSHILLHTYGPHRQDKNNKGQKKLQKGQGLPWKTTTTTHQKVWMALLVNRPRGYENIFIINLAEHEMYHAHKC